MSGYDPFLLAYDTYEPDDGPADYTLSPVIFLHGLTASRKYWDDIPQNVANGTGRKVYVLDARNHGDTDWSDEFSFDIVAKDLNSFMDRHSIRRAVLVGHSMGGMASSKLALAAPERVEKLVVEDMMVRKVPEDLKNMVMGLVMLLQKSLDFVPVGATEDETRKAIVDFILSQVPPTDMPMIKEGSSFGNILPLKKGPDDRFVFKGNLSVILKALQEYDAVTKETEGTFDGPALFIYGTVSPFRIDKEVDDIKKHFPKAEFLGVEGATHMVHGDNAEEFTEALLKFITS